MNKPVQPNVFAMMTDPTRILGRSRLLRRTTVLCLPLLATTIPGCAAQTVIKGPRPQPFDDTYVPEPPGVTVTTWVSGLDTPWSLVFLPGGRALVSERTGAIRVIDQGRLLPEPLLTRDVVHGGEAGLMGLALHPRFPAQPFLYAMETVASGTGTENRVVRFRLENGTARFDRVVLGGLPAGRYHDGGRIKFGPDGLLYIGAGETFQRQLAQDMNSLGGKLLRVTDEGAIPPGNPFPGSPIYTLGNRNPQGLAWDSQTGALLESEHGPSGEVGFGAYDEINIVRPGGNYGWPLVVGAPGKAGLIDPIVAYPDLTTPPSGMTFWHGDLYVATLRSQTLLRVVFDRDGRNLKPRRIERWFASEPDSGRYGRLRDAVVGPDGALYVLTNQRDSRILRIAANGG